MFSVLLFVTYCVHGSYAWARTKCGPTDQVTQWGLTVNTTNVLPEYPRPQMVRGNDESWMNLNGLWEFNGTTDGNLQAPLSYTSEPFATQILVPFPAESCLSGIGQTYKYLQYRRYFDDFANRDTSATRVLLHFGAVDWQSSVYFNGQTLGQHTGGYDSWWFDITEWIQATNNELLVSVYDPSDDGYQPNGKQRISAINNPGGDTYTPASGIWQTVWLEIIDDPTLFISGYKLYPTLSSVSVNVSISNGSGSNVLTLSAIDPSSNSIVAKSIGNEGHLIKLDIPNPKRWDPLHGSPFLYDLNISVENTSEHVMAYFGLRAIELGEYNYSKPFTGAQIGIDRPGDDLPGYPIQLKSADYNMCYALCNNTADCAAWAYAVPGCDQYSNPMCWLKGSVPSTTDNKCRVSGAQGVAQGLQKRPLLNGEPLFLAGWLDQSFWPDGIYTAPTEDALAFDLQSILDYGYNGVRLHQKVNPERWYYWADKLGIIVFQDAVQKYGGASNATIAPFMSDLTAMIEGKFNHPSIVQWETFNEGDCYQVFTQQSGVTVADVVHYTQQLDPTRLVDTDSGGGANNLHVGDVNDIHTYPNPGDPLPVNNAQYGMIGEYGGIGVWVTGRTWTSEGCYGYETVATNISAFEELYIAMTKSIAKNAGDISVTIYTQITDVEDECDGYLSYDRTAKCNAAQKQAIYNANQEMIAAMWGTDIN